MRREHHLVFLLMALTVVLHIAHVTWYLDPESSSATNSAAQQRLLPATDAAAPPPPPAANAQPAPRAPRLLIVTATQPAPCTTQVALRLEAFLATEP